MLLFLIFCFSLWYRIKFINKHTEWNKQIRDLKPRIIIIRLLKSIGVGIIVAAILAMISVLA
ncbi:hypothetical protein ADH74_12555 [Bacteroides caecimuris]|nr:hypothetical protein ADH74_12555 [Bacteroides caecimuris]